jgi:protein-S-isoprenylcysteine O-methyltransferase Ste14
MLLLGGGVTIANPTSPGILGCAVLAASLGIQVRRVEEPHLLETFGREYREYAQRTGRFVPGLGRL